jgi:hypothetical protein
MSNNAPDYYDDLVFRPNSVKSNQAEKIELQEQISNLKEMSAVQNKALILEKINKLRLIDDLGKARKITDTALAALAEIDYLTKSAKYGIHYSPLSCIQQTQEIANFALKRIEEYKI